MTTQTPALRAGILKAFSAVTYLATVQFDGSLQQFVPGIPVSRDLAAGDMAIGRKVAVAFFDPSNHTDAVLFAVWV